MLKSSAVVQTQFASKYLQQLCKHWTHHYKAEFTPTNGVVDFGNEQIVAMKATEGSLVLHASDKDEKGLHELQVAVADHLLRFAFRENVVIHWSRCIAA